MVYWDDLPCQMEVTLRITLSVDATCVLQSEEVNQNLVMSFYGEVNSF